MLHRRKFFHLGFAYRSPKLVLARGASQAFCCNRGTLVACSAYAILGHVHIDLPTHGDNGARRFDVSSKTNRAFRTCLPTAFNFCSTAGDDQTVV